jgi:hypothetical protein
MPSLQREANEMTHCPVISTARRLRIGCTLLVLLAGAGPGLAGVPVGLIDQQNTQAGDTEPSDAGTRANAEQSTIPAAAPVPAPVPAPAAKAPAAVSKTATKPLWSELTPYQQRTLAPLANQWDELDTNHKTKWLALGNKYGSMKPEEQQRVHERMLEWVRLTPEQRRVARESHARAKKLNPDQKSEHWQRYQQLSDEQKKKLAETAASKKPVATLPPPSQAKGKTVAPLKSAARPAPQQPLATRANNDSATLPSPLSATK